MQPLKLYSWHLATAGMFLGAISLTNFTEGDGNLLDPSLDQPIAQYEDFLFGDEDLPERQSNEHQTPKPDQTTSPIPGTTPRPPQTGSELSPNPLRRLLGNEEAEPTPSASEAATQQGEPREAVPAEPVRKEEPRIPQTEQKSAVESQPAESVFDSPFDPKPLVSQPTPQPMVNRAPRASETKPKQKTAAATHATHARGKHPLNFEVYRDLSVYPLDPRKPNNPCTKGPDCGCGCHGGIEYGFKGRPFKPREPGGYRCGKKCPNKHPQYSIYWPRPLSSKLDECFPNKAAARYSGCQKKKLIDCFDKLANFRLIDYNRTDNGYCGVGADPYGCLGESKVAGIGFRSPGAPVAPANAYPIY